MIKGIPCSEKTDLRISKELLKGKRNLTNDEISILEKNLNNAENWQNIFVDENEFDASLVRSSSFSGFVVLGKLKKSYLRYHDLELETGIYRSKICNVVTGDDNVIRNVTYLYNYRLGNRVMLFNIQEMSCTNHSKFGEGVLKEGENEDDRIWIGIRNENEGRAVLPFESMLSSDAYLWSEYRSDKSLMQKFFDFTESTNSKQCNTFGIVGDDVVIKNTTLLKDAKIGNSCYIKGAFKLKNITILSSEEEPSQIGEGVELVNGIMQEGSRAFYQAVAVRFVIGKNCQLKYGARLLNSVLGDNSTVSCCEMLNNLIYPFHEQHHNSSFLIASTIMGQSNIAAGATVGSNHNSRSPDGELIAHRGFWPGLSSDFKHNSRFASFVLASKGSYQYELDILYPFALVTPSVSDDNKITIIPAWWFLYDMFAIARNKYKFKKRDKRVVKMQHIEFDPLAPDTMSEILFALERIIHLSALTLFQKEDEHFCQKAKDYLHQAKDTDLTLFDSICQKKYGAVIEKPVQAYKMYRKVVKYFASRTLIEFAEKNNHSSLSQDVISSINALPLYTEWENVGGQIIPSEKIKSLILQIKNGKINSWSDVHNFYDKCFSEYEDDKTRYAIFLLETLYSRKIEEFTKEIYEDIVSDVLGVSNEMYESAVSSREKDYTDYYRKMVYNSEEEMNAVVGSLQENSFLKELEEDTKIFNKKLSKMFSLEKL
ncbi:MAG: DUF4954 family protein [Treponema sp.]|nr:DUF4954 family protein [Treponema sp.]